MERTDLSTVDPFTRAYALVGQFLQGWALMESQLHGAIGKALGLDDVQRAIVCANIQLRDKLNILKTAVSLSFIQKPERDEFTSLLNEISAYSSTRNMMAHDLFGPSGDDDGVMFWVVKAKGKLDYPSTVWTMADFDQAGEKLGAFTDRLEELERKLQTADIVEALIKATTVSNATMGGLFGLGLPPMPTADPGADADSNPHPVTGILHSD